jgi:hypothetical protein
MDYGKIAEVLHEVADNKDFMLSSNFLSEEFYKEFSDVLELGRCISGGWATSTQDGRTAMRFAWQALCAMRNIDEETDFDNFDGWIQKQARIHGVDTNA